MDLNAFLRRHGLTLPDLLAAVRDRLAPSGNDVLYLSGSLVEGHGTPKSDVDIYFITDRAHRSDFSFGSVLVIPVGDISVDIEFYSHAQVQGIIASLAAFPADEARESRQAAAVSQASIKFLHNLRVGRPFYGAHTYNELAQNVNARALSRVLFDRSVALFESLQVDVMGLLEDEDIRSARYLLNSLLVRLAAAWSAASGDTNPGEKWLVRKLDNARQTDPSLGLPSRPLLPQPADVFGTLTADCDNSREAVSERFEDILHLARIVLPWGQRKFLGPTRLNSAENNNTRTSATPDETSRGEKLFPHMQEPLPRLRKPISVRYRDDTYELFDLFGNRAFRLNDLAYELALHADGNVNRRAVLGHLAQMTCAEPTALAGSIRDFESFLCNYGLV